MGNRERVVVRAAGRIVRSMFNMLTDGRRPTRGDLAAASARATTYAGAKPGVGVNQCKSLPIDRPSPEIPRQNWSPAIFSESISEHAILM
jgi:hypothetical protein